MLTRQEIFDTVVIHAATQLTQCSDSGCKYRHGDNKCWAGALILDEFYDDSFEGDVVPYNLELAITPSSKLLADSLIKSGVKEEDFVLVKALQRIHDTYENWDDKNGMVSALRWTATEYLLERRILNICTEAILMQECTG